MAKTIVIRYEEKEYTLEFNRETILMLEKQGFDASKISMSVIHDLFVGAFKKNHSSMSKYKIEEIYKAIPDLSGLAEALVDMHNEAIDSLQDDESKKVEWTTNW